MRYWLLCGKLKVIENRAYGYHIGGETMGIKTSRFEKIIGDAIRAISDLSNCLEKAEKERNDALELLHSYRHICGETPPERLSELVQADREGRCVVSPCKVGDRLYTIRTIQDGSFTLEVYDSGKIRQISVNTNGTFFLVDYGHSLSANNFGKTVFRTREEAESALKERNGN